MREWPQAKTQSSQVHPTLAPFSCPDCGGVLSQTREGPQALPFFVCQIGHRYAAASLFERKEEKLEETLWSSVTQSKQLRELYETLSREEVLPPGIDRDTVERRVEQLRRQEGEIQAVVMDSPASRSTP
jgi:hypothetical protein